MAVVFDNRFEGAVLQRAGRLAVRVTTAPRQVEAAQRLRYRVFADELGARLLSAPTRLDCDAFDGFCRHIVVEDEACGEVVGTYRVLLPADARRIGALYTEGEFHIDRLLPIRDELVEIGRACVHPDYRTGAVIMLLWAGLGELLAGLPQRYLIGCASVPMADGGHYAASLYRQLSVTDAGPEAFRVFPKDRLPVERLLHGCDVVVPPLVKGYLRAGGQLIGEPHHDRAFGCADLPMMLSLARLGRRHARRFMPGR
jgi:putative hemolysin